MELLRESYEETIVESVIEESTNIKSWYVEGITLQGNTVNYNRRLYPIEVLEKAVEEYKINYMDKNRALAECGHPSVNQTEINLENVCAKFISITKDGNNFRTRAKIGGNKGPVIEKLLELGVSLGISSRGLGSIKESNGTKIVECYKLIAAGDIVHEQSAQLAILDGIMENQQYIYENGVLVQKDLSEDIDQYRKIINESKRSEREAVAKKVVSDYIKRLFN